MTLHEYLSQKRGLASALAARLGVAHTTVLRWSDGSVKPDAAAVEAIVEATDRQVTAADLRPDFARVFVLGHADPDIAQVADPPPGPSTAVGCLGQMSAAPGNDPAGNRSA